VPVLDSTPIGDVVGGWVVKEKRIISNYIIIPFEPDCWLCASIDRMARVCVCVSSIKDHTIFFSKMKKVGFVPIF
jgi:hypothetical protein